MDESKSGMHDLVGDLQQMFTDCTNHHFNMDENMLTEKLVIYITARDHAVFDHAYKLGKESNENQNHQTAD